MFGYPDSSQERDFCMIDFYRKTECPFCDEVVEVLQNLVVAHRVHVLPAGEDFYLQEGKRIYRTHADIRTLLSQLGHVMLIQREMQGDSCKIDPDSGSTC